MAFKKKKLSIQKKLKTKYTRKKTYAKKNKRGIFVKKFIFLSLSIAILFAALLSLILYQKYLKDLPNVGELQDLEIAQASTIYDKEGNELYKIFKEKRTYIDYDKIHSHMVNAIVA